MDPERLANALAESKSVNLDVLSYSQDELVVILYEVFQSTGLPREFGFNDEKLRTFLWAIRTQGYYNNAYHCFEHACDVFLTLHAFLHMTDCMEGQRWSRLHLSAALFAAIIHDMEHPGFNNDFLMKTRAPVAITYNDRSILENHHCAQGFRALLHPRLNFVESLSPQDFNVFRSIAIQLVLATDMSRHGEYMKLTADPLWPTGEPNDIKLLELVLKCADISNIVKPFHIGKQWAVRVTTEFFAQGAKELELGLPLTPMCDSTKTRVSSQIGFSKFVARAAFSALVRIFPSLNILTSNLDENDKRWLDYDDAKLLSEVPVPAWS